MRAKPISSEELEVTLRGMLDVMSERIFAKDLTVVETFWSGGRFWLFGSEEDEHDETREELHHHMTALFSKPYRVRFLFDKLSIDHHHDMAWLNAPAILEIHHPDRTVQLPYRLFALFQRVGDDWHWRVFSGSEPAHPPQ